MKIWVVCVTSMTHKLHKLLKSLLGYFIMTHIFTNLSLYTSRKTTKYNKRLYKKSMLTNLTDCFNNNHCLLTSYLNYNVYLFKNIPTTEGLLVGSSG